MAERVGSELITVCHAVTGQLSLCIDLRRSIEDNRFKLQKKVILMACPTYRPLVRNRKGII